MDLVILLMYVLITAVNNIASQFGVANRLKCLWIQMFEVFGRGLFFRRAMMYCFGSILSLRVAI